jgi:hypothetical protein
LTTGYFLILNRALSKSDPENLLFPETQFPEAVPNLAHFTETLKSGMKQRII